MGDIELQIFSDRLKELRTSLGLTQAQFVEELEITASALSAYEKNQKNPSISVAKRIAEKFHVSIDWLCGLSDKKESDLQPKNYTDTINLLFCLLNTEKLKFEIIKFEDTEAVLFGFDNKKINDFFRDWLKIKKLYDEKVIDKSMYEPWLKSKSNELNCEIKTNTDYSIQDFKNRVEDCLYG